MLLLSRNCSVMRSGSNMRWMSRFGSGRCLPRAAGYGAVLKRRLVDDDVTRVSGLAPGCGSAVTKNASSTPSGCRMRVSCSASFLR